MKFRFTAEPFQKAFERFSTGSRGMKLSDYCAEVANALLESEEAKCAEIFLNRPNFAMEAEEDDLLWEGNPLRTPKSTHTALLWNVEKIEGEK